MLTVFFDCNGVVHHEFLPQGCTVNKEYYLEVMRGSLETYRIVEKLIMDLTLMIVRKFLAKNKPVLTNQPPFFPKLKATIKGKRFATFVDIKSKQELLAILNSAFQKCFDDWKKCRHNCVISEGVTLKGRQVSY